MFPKAYPGLAFPELPGKVPRMHRQPLIAQIREYALRHPEEADVITRFTAFVEKEPDCFERSLAIGHITGSAWVLNADGSEVLLTHHRKLDRWLQLGGHADGESDVLSVAMTEAVEESGLHDFTHIAEGIFDVDIHPIPERKGEPEHLHYDVRYVLRANGSLEYTVSDESHDLRWVKLDDVKALTSEPSMMRMVAKSRLLVNALR